MTPQRRAGRLTDFALVGLLVALKVAVDAWVVRTGFTHVSDDDYARTVIAERAVVSMQTSAQLTSVVEVDVTRVAHFRDDVKDQFLRQTGITVALDLALGDPVVEHLDSRRCGQSRAPSAASCI